MVPFPAQRSELPTLCAVARVLGEDISSVRRKAMPAFLTALSDTRHSTGLWGSSLMYVFSFTGPRVTIRPNSTLLFGYKTRVFRVLLVKRSIISCPLLCLHNILGRYCSCEFPCSLSFPLQGTRHQSAAALSIASSCFASNVVAVDFCSCSRTPGNRAALQVPKGLCIPIP